LGDFVGQKQTVQNLRILMTAAKQRGDVIEHLLFHGPPGLGKTTLAHIIAKETGSNLRTTSGPAIEKPGDLAALLTNLQEGDLLFIDEIHRLQQTVEEILYAAMEDFVLDIVLGKGPAARTLRLTLPKFTLIGATTRSGLLSAPLRDRFGAHYRLDFYDHDELQHIINRSSKLLGIVINQDGSRELAKRSRGTARIANRLLKRVRDYAQVFNKAEVNQTVAKEALDMLGIDEIGLDATDRKLLLALIKDFNGAPVGLKTIASIIAEEPQTIEDVYEPYLMQIGFLNKTPRGRVVLPAAYKHLGLPIPTLL
jgi:Holliday junction DNA helicase RuvB